MSLLSLLLHWSLLCLLWLVSSLFFCYYYLYLAESSVPPQHYPNSTSMTINRNEARASWSRIRTVVENKVIFSAHLNHYKFWSCCIILMYGINIRSHAGKLGDSLVAQMVMSLPAMQRTQVQSLSWDDSPGEGNGTPLQHSCLGNPIAGGAWQATVHKVG